MSTVKPHSSGGLQHDGTVSVHDAGSRARGQLIMFACEPFFSVKTFLIRRGSWTKWGCMIAPNAPGTLDMQITDSAPAA
jgi:hypothetical protein